MAYATLTLLQIFRMRRDEARMALATPFPSHLREAARIDHYAPHTARFRIYDRLAGMAEDETVSLTEIEQWIEAYGHKVAFRHGKLTLPLLRALGDARDTIRAKKKEFGIGEEGGTHV